MVRVSGKVKYHTGLHLIRLNRFDVCLIVLVLLILVVHFYVAMRNDSVSGVSVPPFRSGLEISKDGLWEEREDLLEERALGKSQCVYIFSNDVAELSLYIAHNIIVCKVTMSS